MSILCAFLAGALGGVVGCLAAFAALCWYFGEE